MLFPPHKTDFGVTAVFIVCHNKMEICVGFCSVTRSLDLYVRVVRENVVKTMAA